MFITSSSSPLNAIIYLLERARGDDVVHPLDTESAAQLDRLHVALPGACERREQETHGQSVVYIPQSVDKRRIPVRTIAAVNIKHHVEKRCKRRKCVKYCKRFLLLRRGTASCLTSPLRCGPACMRVCCLSASRRSPTLPSRTLSAVYARISNRKEKHVGMRKMRNVCPNNLNYIWIFK